jgi:hypothetical protein
MTVKTTSRPPSSAPKEMASTEERLYSGRSETGDFGEALSKAIQAARTGLNTNFFTWRLHHVSGSVGGFVNARDVSVSIAAGKPHGASVTASGKTSTCGDWHAWHDRMPGKKPTLHVTGVCTFPTAGYSVELRPKEPQGINPAIYMLEKVVTKPTIPVPEVITDVPVYYREQTGAAYKEVHILPDDAHVPVQEVS